MKPITIVEAMNEMFSGTFRRRLLKGDTWAVWKVFLSALFALPLDEKAKAIYTKHTGRSDAPTEPFRECFIIVGRRGGKSIIAALVAVTLACFRDYRDILAPGEIGVVMILAADRRQARVILGYINAFLSIPLLASMVVDRLKESITLDNRVQIEIHTSSFKATRGYTLVAAICDEIAFWPQDESASPDTEILNALRPGLSTTNGLLLGISSPYAKRGELWTNYRMHYGQNDSDVLIWKSDSRSMNPTLSAAVVAAAYLRDSSSARAEFGGEFRDDVETFISIDVVESRVIAQRFELPFSSAYNYVGFCDPSGGAHDSFCLGIAHVTTTGLAVLDCVREVVPPFSPESVCSEFAATLKSYGISEVTGDRYAGEWPREQFRKYGVEYVVSERTKSEIYLSFLPMLMSGTMELLDSKRLVQQLVGLERRTARGGRDSVDHSPGGHDDIANAAAGALVLATGPQPEYGLTAFMQRLLTGQYTMPPAPKPEIWRIGNETRWEGSAQWNQPQPPPCPSCKSMCAWIGGGGARCIQCGMQTFPNGKPQVPQTNRLNYHDRRQLFR
jgi:hypothetical protein